MPRFSAAQRLDRLPIGAFHRRILFLIGAGMFLDNFDATLQGGVLGTLTASHWSTMASNARFISATFLGMLIGSFCAGVLGDRYGRRFAYQINLLIIGLTSFAAALAPSMEWLIGARLVMGFGLGAELVIGYSTLAEFVPPRLRGRWIAYLAFITNIAVAASALAGYFVIPAFGWRVLLRWPVFFERLGLVLWPAFSGVIIVEASKQVYGALPAKARAKMRRQYAPVPATS